MLVTVCVEIHPEGEVGAVLDVVVRPLGTDCAVASVVGAVGVVVRVDHESNRASPHVVVVNEVVRDAVSADVVASAGDADLLLIDTWRILVRPVVNHGVVGHPNHRFVHVVTGSAADRTDVDQHAVVDVEVAVVVTTVVTDVEQLRAFRTDSRPIDIVEVGGGTVRVASIHVCPTVRVESCREHRGPVERGIRGAEVRPRRVKQDVLVLHVRRERVVVAVLGYSSTLTVGLGPRRSRCKVVTAGAGLQYVVGRRSEAVADAGVEAVGQRHRFLVARGIGQSQ